MNPMFYLYIAIFIVVLVLLAIFTFRRKPKRKQSIQRQYIEGLHALLSGDREHALETLRDVVRRDTDFIDAYIIIGTIFREKGRYENAIKIHRDLLVRPNLTRTQQKQILMNLAQDYYDNNQPKWALSTCDKLLELDKKDPWVREFKLELYEYMGDWQGAFDILKKNGGQKAEKNARLAAYKVEQGLQLVSMKQEHDARLRYREALKLKQNFFPAHMELVHSYIRDKRENDALKELKKLVQHIPEYADIALNTFEDLLFEMGHFDDIETFYKQIVQSNPKLMEAYLGLAEIYDKKGELRHASEICQQALKQQPNSLKVKLFLIKIERKLQRFEAAADYGAQVADAFLDKQYEFVCSECGHSNDHYFWHCPSCHSWNTAERSV